MHLYIGNWQVAGEQLSALSVIANHGPGWAFSVQYTKVQVNCIATQQILVPTTPLSTLLHKLLGSI